MEIAVGNSTTGKLDTLYIRHKGEELEWHVKTYNRSMITDIHRMFANINGYIASLGGELQDRLWQCFCDAKQAMEDINEAHRLKTRVQTIVRDIYDIITFEDLKRWVMVYGRIDIPADLKSDYTGISSELTRRLTYPRPDFYDLCVLSILLKPMIPIFGEYIWRMDQEVGTRFKEHHAFSLLSKSPIISLPAFKRLREYVEAKAENEQRKAPSEYRKNSAILGGLGTEELPDWLLSRMVVRRVAIYEESVNDNIVARIFHAIDQQINSLDKTFRGRVADKPLFNGKSEEDNISVAENYKVKQGISDGDLAVLSIFTDEIYDMAGRVDPTFDKHKVKLCTDAHAEHPKLGVEKHHITITQWVLSSAMPPRGIPFLNKPALLKTMGVTQALLWHWGFTELALLMLAEPSPEFSLAANKPTTRLSKKYTDLFSKLYPHYQQVSRSAASNTRNVNVACRAIDNLSGHIIHSDWKVYGPKELIQEIGLKDLETPYVVSAEIRQQLGNLVLKIQSVRNGTELEKA